MLCNNPILIGGSGSTGSTLLATILNRHPEIAIGPELSLFNKPKLYQISYEIFRDNLDRYLTTGTSTRGWHLYWPTMREIKHFGWDNNSLLKLSKECNSAREFSDGFFDHFLIIKKKKTWGEKTPSNSYQFDSFLRLYPNARIIHIVRDARDVVSSLKSRGMDSYSASMLWLYNTAMGLRIKENDLYYQISYEDLVQDTENTLAYLCDFLSIDYLKDIIEPQSEKSEKNILSWDNSPGGSIKSISVGKYKNQLDSFDYFVIDRVRISKTHIENYGLKNDSINSISVLSYKYSRRYSTLTRLYYIIRLVAMVMKDRIRRILVMLLIDREFYSFPGGIIIRGFTK